MTKTPPMVDPRDAELAACPKPCHLCGAPMIRDGKQWRHSPERGEGCFLFLQYLDDEDDIAAWNDVREPLRRPEPLAGSGVADRDSLIRSIEVTHRIAERSDDLTHAMWLTKDEWATILAALRAHPAPEQSAHCSGEVVEVVARVGTFPRIVSHEDALQAAKNFVDQHFNNRDGKGVLTSIPAKPDDDDVTLVDYIKQQRAIAALSAPRPDVWSDIPCAEALTTLEKQP
jgi:hypothetical protein